jgi:hypothetical protein
MNKSMLKRIKSLPLEQRMEIARSILESKEPTKHDGLASDAVIRRKERQRLAYAAKVGRPVLDAEGKKALAAHARSVRLERLNQQG